MYQKIYILIYVLKNCFLYKKSQVPIACACSMKKAKVHANLRRREFLLREYSHYLCATFKIKKK